MSRWIKLLITVALLITAFSAGAKTYGVFVSGGDKLETVDKWRKKKAEEMAKEIKRIRPGAETEVVTKRHGDDGIEKVLENMVNKLKCKPEADELVIYFNGHGTNKTWNFANPKGSIGTFTIEKILKKVPCCVKIHFVIHTCHSGSWTDPLSEDPHVVSIYTCCQSDQKNYKDFWVIIEGSGKNQKVSLEHFGEDWPTGFEEDIKEVPAGTGLGDALKKGYASAKTKPHAITKEKATPTEWRQSDNTHTITAHVEERFSDKGIRAHLWTPSKFNCQTRTVRSLDGQFKKGTFKPCVWFTVKAYEDPKGRFHLLYPDPNDKSTTPKIVGPPVVGLKAHVEKKSGRKLTVDVWEPLLLRRKLQVIEFAKKEDIPEDAKKCTWITGKVQVRDPGSPYTPIGPITLTEAPSMNIKGHVTKVTKNSRTGATLTVTIWDPESARGTKRKIIVPDLSKLPPNVKMCTWITATTKVTDPGDVLTNTGDIEIVEAEQQKITGHVEKVIRRANKPDTVAIRVTSPAWLEGKKITITVKDPKEIPPWVERCIDTTVTVALTDPRKAADLVSDFPGPKTTRVTAHVRRVDYVLDESVDSQEIKCFIEVEFLFPRKSLGGKVRYIEVPKNRIPAGLKKCQYIVANVTPSTTKLGFYTTPRVYRIHEKRAKGQTDSVELKDGAVQPLAGDTSDNYTYSITYIDPENIAPTVIDVFIDGTLFEMTQADPGDTDYTDGAEFQYVTELDENNHIFHFEAMDGDNGVRLPATGEFNGPEVTLPDDTTLPSISCPDNLILECPEPPDPSITGTATASDDTDPDPVVTFDDVAVPANDPEIQTIIRTWTATDAARNSSSCDQIIVITDTTPPTISGVPDDATVECAALPPPVAVTAIDACDANPTVSLDLTFSSPGAGELVVITRTWTATDADSNSSSASQTITVIDTIPPEISCPPDASVACLGDIDPSNTGSATGSDTCGGITINFNDTLMSGANCRIERVWTTADWCSNETSCEQTITLTDNEAPVITCPDSAELECPADTSSNATGEATATDNCEYEISSSDETTPGCGDTLKIERTWTATDSCGNSSSCVQMIEVIDTTAPSIACPPSITLECPTDTGVGANGSATGSDTCGDVTSIVSSDSSAPGCGGSETITRTWTATDECNNSNSCDQVITVLDTAAPEITCPADVTVECTGSTAPGGSNSAATATDACSGYGITYSDASAPGCGNTETITRSWTATDECGNNSSCDQTLAVVDTTAPTISCPDDSVIECTSSSATGVTGEATGSDSCGGVSIDHSDSVADGDCGDNTVITRTFTATDDCGNSNSCTQTIKTEDTTGPSITCPDDAVVECATSISPDVTGGPTASDTCGDVKIVYSDDGKPDGCGKNAEIVREFTAIDDCGNSTSCKQTITSEDTTSPSIACPADATVECLTDSSPVATGSATGSDTCGDVTIGSSDNSAPGCGGSETITRTWTATDECNNSNSCDQTITVVDTTAPVIACPPDVTVECAVDSPTGAATATDACSGVGITRSDASAPGCGNSETITRTWTATDDCDNASSCDQTITIVDTTAPSISCPGDGTVECGESTRVGSATGGDSCGGIRVNSADSFEPSCGGDAGVITRTWTATDDCGNSTSCGQTVTIIDTTPPELSCNANDITEFDGDDDDDDDDDVSFTATAVDVCSNVRVKVGWIISVPPPGDDDDDDDDSKVRAKGATITILESGDPGTVINWTAKSIDDCGNISAVSCSVTVLEKEKEHGDHGDYGDHDDDDGHPWWGHHW